ncbi:hypothetical protein BS78_10G174700 [Paspalum vaginatum]|nr:hypothetical protein BS78_10G174700 [Paspalum vaginatum]
MRFSHFSSRFLSHLSNHPDLEHGAGLVAGANRRRLRTSASASFSKEIPAEKRSESKSMKRAICRMFLRFMFLFLFFSMQTHAICTMMTSYKLDWKRHVIFEINVC